MTKWAVLGSSGMLGQELVDILGNENCIALARKDCDISDINQVRESLQNIDFVINCAAWTSVDEAEKHETEAQAINGQGAGNVATVCAENEIRLVHISTDYVFPGNSHSPYGENAATGPKSAYGRSKLAGEIAVQRAHSKGSYIVRTAWLYGEHGSNFVKTMIELEAKNQSISVVSDQLGQPTWTRDLAKKLIQLIDSGAPLGIYHGTSSGQTTWFGFAQKIFSLIGADPERVKPVSSNEYSRLAKRPDYSVLGHKRWEEAMILPIQNWEKAIEQAFEENVF